MTAGIIQGFNETNRETKRQLVRHAYPQKNSKSTKLETAKTNTRITFW